VEIIDEKQQKLHKAFWELSKAINGALIEWRNERRSMAEENKKLHKQVFNYQVKEVPSILTVPPPFENYAINELRKVTSLQERINQLEHENKLLKAKSKAGILEGYIDKIKELESELAKWKKYEQQECEISNKYGEKAERLEKELEDFRDVCVELKKKNDKLEEKIREKLTPNIINLDKLKSELQGEEIKSLREEARIVREKLEEMLPVYQRAGTIDYLLKRIKERVFYNPRAELSRAKFIKSYWNNFGGTITITASFEQDEKEYRFDSNGRYTEETLDKLLHQLDSKIHFIEE
jgi:DNA repair exonuclease SbcCD ATPase subunit